MLETVNPSRAFLAIDSAFPLAELELAYRRGESFQAPFGPTTLPVLFDRAYWRGAARRDREDFLDMFIEDPGLARLYVAMYNLHQPTAQALRAAVPVQRLKDYAPVIDFFGAMFEVRDGVAIVPGGDRSRSVWEKLTGARVARGGEFFQVLVEADDGWMAAYYDALARIQDDLARAYFLNPARIERFYRAVRGRVTSPGPARPIFRASADLLLLSTRVDFSPDGQPKIPGGIEPWRELFVKHPHGKYDGKLTASAAGWRDPDDVHRGDVRSLEEGNRERALADVPDHFGPGPEPHAAAIGGHGRENDPLFSQAWGAIHSLQRFPRPERGHHRCPSGCHGRPGQDWQSSAASGLDRHAAGATLNLAGSASQRIDPGLES